METYRVKTTVSQDGKLSIKGLPFRAGEKVEVIVRGEKKKAAHGRKRVVKDLKALFKEIQALPQAKTITEEDIASEITAYRKSKTK
ncbi:MAG TPA: hypothetical protein VK249_03890 [Anaerolineales bacterium]|nr:hypothetical protein [Anaerolineales bacterium]